MRRKMISRGFSGVPTDIPRPYEAQHAAIARQAAAEGIVLLENSILPLPKGAKVALFGAGASKTVKGGTGSGDVNERYSVSVYEGLKNAGFTVTTEDWIADYDRRYAAAREEWKREVLSKVTDGGPGFFNAYASTPFRMPVGAPAHKTDTDTALFVIARIAGEGADRFAGEGDYFLSHQEHRLLADICGLYETVIVLVNAGGVVDLSFMDEFPQIKALLVISQPGMEGGNAVADVLSGRVNPSGKLADTWAMRYEDYPNAATFSHNNGNVSTEEYTEGLYVGYRYFDSFGVKPRYGFGFGRSYTEFSMETLSVTTDNRGNVTLEAAVTNTGSVPGKEVAQVYASLPVGTLEKEARRLAAFAKTKLLAPGETEVLTIAFPASRLESYDETAAAWVLEAGSYVISLGSSLESCRPAAVLTLEADKLLEQLTNICPLKQELKTLSLPEALRRQRYARELEAAAQAEKLVYDLSGLETRVVDYTAEEQPDEASRLVEGLSTEQLILLASGDPARGQDSALGSAGVSVPGSAGETSRCAVDQGIANISLADGPAGLRLNQKYYVNNGVAAMLPFELSVEHGFFYDGPEPEGTPYYQYCTAIPVGALLAQSWNMALLETVGSAIGEEMTLFGVQLWLAPGMNLHRNPLCGRNFEYFAEDPLLSGKCAAAITRGVQSHRGVGTTIKHFACNNQEDNRMCSNSVVPERVLRELYLKGFEIAVQESKPLSIMTSYNLINGVHAANSYDLCTRVVREEFGFTGVIMTDWTTTNLDDSCTASGCMRAGNDLIMPGMASDHDNLRRELAAGTLTPAQLRRCVTHLVRVILNSSCYES